MANRRWLHSILQGGISIVAKRSLVFQNAEPARGKADDKNLRPKRLGSGESLRNFIEIPETLNRFKVRSALMK